MNLRSLIDLASLMFAIIAVQIFYSGWVDPSLLAKPASGLPLVALNPKNVPLRASLLGKVISMLVASSTGAVITRSRRSSCCWNSIMLVSKSVSKLVAFIVPPLVYTLDRASAVLDIMVTIWPFVGVLPDVKVIDPAPVEAVILTV